MIAPRTVTRTEYAPVTLSPRITVRFAVHPSITIADAFDHVLDRALASASGPTPEVALVNVKVKLRALRRALMFADLEGE